MNTAASSQTSWRTPRTGQRRAVEEAEAKLAAHNDYEAFKGMGEEQPEYLKAMDFMDVLTPRI
eukprot:812299-Lingulodinium_polyedra.AAC.1